MEADQKTNMYIGAIFVLILALIFLGIAYDKKGQSPTKDDPFITYHFVGNGKEYKLADSIAYFGAERSYVLLGNLSTEQKVKAKSVSIKLAYVVGESERVINEQNVVCTQGDLNACLNSATVFIAEKKGYDEFFPQSVIDNFSKGLRLTISYVDKNGKKHDMEDTNLSFEKYINNKLSYEKVDHI